MNNIPNHVRNELYFNCNNKEELNKILNAIKGDDGRAIDFEKIIPMPDNIFRGNLGVKEKELYGENNWYNWSCENWGTKWNAYETEQLGNGVAFLTAWSSPFPVIHKLSEMFPTVEITHYFADEDIGFNCGKFTYIGGEESNDSDFEDGTAESAKFACDMWGYDYDEFEQYFKE